MSAVLRDGVHTPHSQIDPSRVEAHAAQGYSLIDVARLIGVSKNEIFGSDLIDAYNCGARRWKENGSPIPPRVNDLIVQAIHAELNRREMTRAELRDALGYGYSDLNFGIESLMEQGAVEREDDAGGTSYFRGSGLASPIAKKRNAENVRSIPIETVAVTISEHATIEPEPPHSNGDGTLEQKISARSPYTSEVATVDDEEDISGDAELTREGFENVLGKVSRKLCGCGRLASHLGRCAYRRAQAGGDFPAKKRATPDPRRGPTYKELNLVEVEDVMASEETIDAGARKLGMTSAQLYVRRQKDTAVDKAIERGRERYYAPDSPDENKQSSHIGRPQIIIDLVRMEELLADPDLSMGEVGERLGVGRNTIYKRKDTDAEFKAAYERGLARREQACTGR